MFDFQLLLNQGSKSSWDDSKYHSCLYYRTQNNPEQGLEGTSHVIAIISANSTLTDLTKMENPCLLWDSNAAEPSTTTSTPQGHIFLK